MPYLAQLVQLDFSRHQKLKFDIRTRQMFLQQEIHLFRGKKVCKTAGIWTLQQFQDLFLPTFARELKVLCEPRAWASRSTCLPKQRQRCIRGLRLRPTGHISQLEASQSQSEFQDVSDLDLSRCSFIRCLLGCETPPEAVAITSAGPLHAMKEIVCRQCLKFRRISCTACHVSPNQLRLR